MPTYKFQYFDVRARGELCRYVFHAAGKEFDDVRVTGDTWQSIKPTTPFGQMPVLTIDGKKLAQGTSIARFLAREFGLAGKNSWEQAQIDQFIGLAEDLFTEMAKSFFEKDEDKKKELTKNFNEVVVPKFCGLFEKALEQNGGKFFVGGVFTLADLAVLNGLDTAVMKNPKLMDAFPKLKAHRERIAALPNIASYLKNRKHSDL